MSTSSEDFSEFLFIGSHGNLTCVDVDAMCVLDKVDIHDDIFINPNVKPVPSGLSKTADLAHSQQHSHQPTDINTNIVSVYSSLIKSLTYLVVSITETGNLFSFFLIKKISNLKFKLNSSKASF